jgi:hypothetical protein
MKTTSARPKPPPKIQTKKAQPAAAIMGVNGAMRRVMEVEDSSLASPTAKAPDGGMCAFRIGFLSGDPPCEIGLL